MVDTSDRHDELLSKLADEFATRQRNGEKPRLEEYCARYPDLAEDIRSLFPALVELERAKLDAGALAADLQRFLDDEPIRARRQTTVETVWRWARQHRSVASLVAVVVLLLLGITVGSVISASHFRDQEMVQRGLVQAQAAMSERNQRLAEESEAAKQKAEDAQKKAETTLVDMQSARGMLAAEKDDPARAVLWFAKAAEAAASDPARQADNLLRTRNWAGTLTIPVRAFPLAHVRVMLFRPGGDLLLLLTEDRLFVRDWRRDKYISWADGIPKVSSTCWSPDGKRLAIGYYSGMVQIRDVSDGRVLHEVKRSGAATALAFSPDGRYLAMASTVVSLMASSSGTLLPGEWKHPQEVHSLLFSRAGDRLITASQDKKARMFAVGGGQAPLFDPFPHEPEHPSPPALVENDRRLITVSAFGSEGSKPAELTCWDMETGKPAGPGVVRARLWMPSGVVASPRGDWFAAGGISGLEVWKTTDGTKSIHLSEHTGRVEDFVPSPDGKTLLSTSWDQTARFWSIADGKSLGSPLPHMGIVSRCAFAGDNIHLATFSAGLVRIWKRSDGEMPSTQSVNWLGTPRPSYDGRLIAPGNWHEKPYGFTPIGGGELLVTHATTGAPAGPAITLRGQLVDSCVCADNRTVAAVSDDKGGGWLTLADVFTGKALAEPIRLPGSPRSVAARPSSTQVAVLCGGGELPIFDCHNGERILNLNHEGQTAWRHERVEYTADGNTLVTLTGARDQFIHIRDAESGRPRCPPILPVLKGGPCRSFALSADSRMIATAVNGKNAAQVWDLATGNPLSQPLPHPGDTYGLYCLCFSPDGRRLLTGCKDGQARLWDWRLGTLVCPPMKHVDEVLSVAMTPDGQYALTSGRLQASQLHVWELTTGKLVAPRIPLPIHATVCLASSANDLHVVASSAFVGLAAHIDLARLLSSPDMTLEDYRILGELASGQRIEQGDESGLTQDEWLERLNQFSQRHSR